MKTSVGSKFMIVFNIVLFIIIGLYYLTILKAKKYSWIGRNNQSNC